MDEHVKKQLK